MRILILGASGGVGRWATRLAAADGHSVTAFVRPSTPFQPPRGVTVQRGSATEAGDLVQVVRQQDAIISCIGPQRVNPKNPWSPLKPPLGVARLSALAVLSAMRGAAVGRVAVISAAGVGDTGRTMNRVIRWLINHSTIGDMYRDLAAMEAVLRESSVDWVAVRPVTLVNTAPSRRTKRLTRFRTVSIVGRADVAAWLIRTVVDPAPITDRTPMIGWW